MSDKVEISKVALAALFFSTTKYVRRQGHFANRNAFGEIEIADALREAGDPLRLGYDPREDPSVFSLDETP